MNRNPLLEYWENLTDDELNLALLDWFKRNRNSIEKDKQFWNRTNIAQTIQNELIKSKRWKGLPRGNPHKGKRIAAENRANRNNHSNYNKYFSDGENQYL